MFFCIYLYGKGDGFYRSEDPTNSIKVGVFPIRRNPFRRN